MKKNWLLIITSSIVYLAIIALSIYYMIIPGINKLKEVNAIKDLTYEEKTKLIDDINQKYILLEQALNNKYAPSIKEINDKYSNLEQQIKDKYNQKEQEIKDKMRSGGSWGEPGSTGPAWGSPAPAKSPLEEEGPSSPHS